MSDTVELLNKQIIIDKSTMDGITALTTLVDGMHISNTILSNVSEFDELLQLCFRKYEEGTIVIDIIAESMGEIANPNFEEAMKQVRQEYNDAFFAMMSEMMRDAEQELAKGIVKEAIKAISNTPYTVTRVAMDILFKLSGETERTDNIMKFTAAATTYQQAMNAYQNSIYAVVRDKDTSDEAYKKLYVCYHFTCSCADSLYSTLYELYSTKADKDNMLRQIPDKLLPDMPKCEKLYHDTFNSAR